MSGAITLRADRTRPSSRPRRRTIRVRLTALFFAVFVASGAVLLAVTAAVWESRTGSMAVAAVPISHLQPAATGITEHSSDRHELVVASAIALALMAGVSLAVGWLVAGRFLRPLRTMTATTREISATNLHERLNLAGADDELKELGDTVDELLARLERSFTFERQFVANAAHELRTPLAGMRASLDVATAKPEPLPAQMQTLAVRLRRELDHVERLLESFLTLSQSQQAPPTDRATVSLDDLARVAIAEHAEAITAGGLTVEQHASDAWVSGNVTLLSRLVGNVVDNALTHNQPGGWLRVSTAVEGEQARLVVENGGAVLDPADVGDLTQPFRRVGAPRTGSDKGAGLGLAIVSSIVEVHGGALGLEARDGGGLCVTVTLPRATGARTGVPS